MRLLDKLRNLNPFASHRPVEAARPDLATVVAKGSRTAETKAAIRENPSTFNRATRRLYGFFGRAVPLDWVEPELQNFVPRYIRRHQGVLQSRPTTRRQRKQHNRAMRIADAYRLGGRRWA